MINGRGVVTGNDRVAVDAAIRRFARGAAGPSIDGDRRSVAVGAAGGKATVWLVSYDPRTIAVPIRAGENGGRTIPHRNIVRLLVTLGKWSGGPARYALPTPQPGLAMAVLLQAGPGGPIIAARKL